MVYVEKRRPGTFVSTLLGKSLRMIFLLAFLSQLLSCTAQIFNWAVIPLSAAVLAGMSIELYSLLPQQLLYGSTPPPLPQFETSLRHIAIVFPGAGGSDANTERIVTSIQKTSVDANISRFVVCYDWKPWCGNVLRAAIDSECVGQRLGRQLAELQLAREIDGTLPGFESIHVIGVSVGAFAANSCIKSYKKELEKLRNDNNSFSSRLGLIRALNLLKKTSSPKIREDTAFCRLSLLDPFTLRGYVMAICFFDATIYTHSLLFSVSPSSVQHVRITWLWLRRKIFWSICRFL